VNDLDVRIFTIDAAVAQIDEDLLGWFAGIFKQDTGLLQLRRENVTVVRVAGEGPGADDQTTLVGDEDAGLDAEFVALARLAFADALNFGGMQGVKLVLVVDLLRADAFGALEQRVQTSDGRGTAPADCAQLAADFAQDDAEDGALPFDGTSQAAEPIFLT